MTTTKKNHKNLFPTTLSMPLFLTVTTPSSREVRPSPPTATRVAPGSSPPPDKASLPPACGPCNHNRKNFKFKGTSSLKSTAFDPNFIRVSMSFGCLNAWMASLLVETVLLQEFQVNKLPLAICTITNIQLLVFFVDGYRCHAASFPILLFSTSLNVSSCHSWWCLVVIVLKQLVRLISNL